MTNWQARVDWIGAPLTDEQGTALLAQLAPHSPAVGPDLHGRQGATISILGKSTLRQAVAAAITAVENAGRFVGVPITASGVGVVDEGFAELEYMEPGSPELVGYAEIADLAGVSRQRAQQLGHLEGFPAAVVITKAGPLRAKRAVEAWLKLWERKPAARNPDERTETTIRLLGQGST